MQQSMKVRNVQFEGTFVCSHGTPHAVLSADVSVIGDDEHGHVDFKRTRLVLDRGNVIVLAHALNCDLLPTMEKEGYIMVQHEGAN